MELYLIRHTRPQVAPGICYGQTDLSVADDYATDLARLKCVFSTVELAHIYSSPLQRCQRLAQDLFTETARVDRRLMEINFGSWEMVAWENIAQHELQSWSEDLVHFKAPCGESLFDLDRRVDDFYQALLRQHADSQDAKIAIVCHAGVIRSLLCRLMGMPLDAHLNWQIDYGAVSKVIVEQQFVRLCYSNQLSA